MNALNFANRCARLYLVDWIPTSMAVDKLLLADAITQAIEKYWRKAPNSVTAPQGDTSLTLTVANGGVVALLSNVEQFLRAPRIRTGPTASWQPLGELQTNLFEPATIGTPMWFRIESIMQDYPLGAAPEGDTANASYLKVWPTPDRTYELDFWARYGPPRIAGKHLAGLATTINLPIPDNDVTSIVLPLCANALLSHPLKKPSLSPSSAAFYATEAMDLLSAHPTRRTITKSRCGTPLGY